MVEKPKPTLIEPADAIVRVTMSSICSSDLHIKHGSVPRAVPGITVGHEMVGVVEAVGEVVALYDRPQILPLPDMYGKDLTFKTGGVDGCDCEKSFT